LSSLGRAEPHVLATVEDAPPGRPATYDAAGQSLTPATIGCTIPEVFDDVLAGEPIWFDDGTIGGTIEKSRTEPAARAHHPDATRRRPVARRLGHQPARKPPAVAGPH
jgi:hypothetical protein